MATRTKDPLKARLKKATFLLICEDAAAEIGRLPRGLVRRETLEEEDAAVEEVVEVVTVTEFGTRNAELTARTTGREEEEDEEAGEEEIEEVAEDGAIEVTVAVTCPPTIGGRMTVLMIATMAAAEIAAMEDAEVDVEAMMVDAVIDEVEEADTLRTGPSLWPETRELRRNSSTLNMVHQGSTLKGEHQKFLSGPLIL